MAIAIPLSTSPLPWTDLASNLSAAADRSWGRTLRDAFRPAVEYRPLLTVWIKAAYQVFGVAAWPYFALLLQYAAVLALLLRLLRPVGARRGIAAMVALACLVGLHTSRAMLGLAPVNAPSVGLILLLFGAVLALDRPTSRLDWLFLPLTAIALLLLESGTVMVPLVLVLLIVKAPGIGWRGAAVTVAMAAGYMAIRRMGSDGGAGLPLVYTETGLGFDTPSVARLTDIFKDAPWLFWSYNSMATLFTVLFSEPRQGVFVFVKSLLEGAAPTWLWLHVLSSTLTTATIAAGLMAGRPFADRDRRLVAGGLVLLFVGSALGFLYTRDRIALTAGVGYIVLAYVAIARLLEQSRTPWRRLAATLTVAIVAAAWTCRTLETSLQLRDAAWDFHLEWKNRYGDQPAGPPDSVAEQLRVAAMSRPPADPRNDPTWTYKYFQRKF